MLCKASFVLIRKVSVQRFLCKRGPVLPLSSMFPPSAHVGGRVEAWECELDPALISQAANCYCSLDAKHNFFLLGISSVILHITQLLCSAMQLIERGTRTTAWDLLNLKELLMNKWVEFSPQLFQKFNICFKCTSASWTSYYSHKFTILLLLLYISAGHIRYWNTAWRKTERRLWKSGFWLEKQPNVLVDHKTEFSEVSSSALMQTQVQAETLKSFFFFLNING